MPTIHINLATLIEVTFLYSIHILLLIFHLVHLIRQISPDLVGVDIKNP